VALILDTGPVFASLDRSDRHHRSCRALIAESHEQLVLPAPILPEVDYFVSEHLGVGAMLAVLGDIRRGSFVVEDLQADDYVRVEGLIDQYADQQLGFVDAAIVAIAERLGEPKVVTLDRRHFSIVRPRHVDAFMLLPE